MPSNREIQIILKAVDKASAELRAASGEIKQLGATAKKSGGDMSIIGDTLRNIGREAVMGAAGLAAVGIAAKKAFDLAHEGAMIQQTAESFDMLMGSLGAAPNILQQMKDAVGGTVDEMSLMSSTMTLVAGANSELAASMVDAAPRLLEIAKAANKLNPSLGSTTFLYESLARGIKRSSPLILDNTGLVIKVGEANQEYADSLGVTVEALTAADKQQALLNAALKAGDVLIQQVGGSTESAADSFERLAARATEASNSLKARVVPAGTAVVESLEKLFFWTDVANEAFDEIESGARDSAGSFDEYRAAIDAAMDGTRFLVNDSGDLIDRYGTLYEANAALTEAQWNSNRAIANGSREMQGYFTHMRNATSAVTSLGDASDHVERVGDIMYNAAGGFDMVAGSVRDLQRESREAEQAMRDMAATASEVANDLSNVDMSTKALWKDMTEAAIAAGATDEEIIQLAIDTDLVTEAEARATVTRRDLLAATEAGTVSAWEQGVAMRHLDEWQRLTDESAGYLAEGNVELAEAAAGAAEKELEIVAALVEAGGAADDTTTETDELIGKYGEVPADVDTQITTTPSTSSLMAGVQNYINTINAIPAEKRTRIIQEYVSTRGGSPISGTGGYAAGTPYVPENGLAYLHRGEAVLPRSEAQEYRAGGATGGTVVIAPIILERGDYTDANGDLMFEQLAEMVQAQQGGF